MKTYPIQSANFSKIKDKNARKQYQNWIKHSWLYLQHTWMNNNKNGLCTVISPKKQKSFSAKSTRWGICPCTGFIELLKWKIEGLFKGVSRVLSKKIINTKHSFVIGLNMYGTLLKSRIFQAFQGLDVLRSTVNRIELLIL